MGIINTITVNFYIWLNDEIRQTKSKKKKYSLQWEKYSQILSDIKEVKRHILQMYAYVLHTFPPIKTVIVIHIWS